MYKYSFSFENVTYLCNPSFFILNIFMIRIYIFFFSRSQRKIHNTNYYSELSNLFYHI